MKLIKRLFFAIIFLLLLVICAAIVIPTFYKDEIVSYIKTDVNKMLDAEIDFDDVSISLFRNFPKLSFGLKDFSIVGKEEFEGIPLAKIGNLDFSLDLMSVVKSQDNIKIHGIYLEDPEIHVKVLKNGKANYLVMKDSGETEATEPTEPTKFEVKLEEYEIKNGKLTYDDRASDVFLHLEKLNHSGQADFSQDIFDIATQTDFTDLTAKSGGVKYLSKADGNMDLTLNADLPNSKFTIKNNKLLLNSLELNTDGTVQLSGDDVIMDLRFDAPGDNFKNLLSLIPGSYSKDFKDVDADGKVKLAGNAKGTFNAAKNQMPAFKLNLEVANGRFKYPDLPMGIKDIATVVNINSPSSDLDKMQIDIPNFKMILGQNPFEAKFKLKTPISDPDVDAKIKGILNLADLAKAFPVEGVKQMSGIINADIVTKTKLSQVDRQDYENIDIQGVFKATDIVYLANGMPKVLLNHMDMDFTPKQVNVTRLDAKLGKSDLRGEGSIDNMLAWFSPEKTMRGKFVIKSNYFDINEWMTESTSSNNTPPQETPTTEEAVFDRFDFTVDARFKKMDYDVYKLNNVIAVGNFTPEKFRFDKFETKIGQSDIAISGQINNVFDYVFENETLTGNIDLNSNLLDLNELMATTDGEARPVNMSMGSEEPAGAYLVPENMDIDLNANIGKVIYTNMDLKDMRGKIAIEDEQAKLQNVSARTLGGKVNMNGSYDSRDKKNPGFDLDYDVQSMSFRQTFEKLNTVQQLLPIMQFIEGNFNTKMSLNGKLGEDMVPDFNSLNADGFMQTLRGVIKNFKPLEEVGNKLNVSYFKALEIKDTKNWFEIKNGAVELKDFDYKYKDIDMKIGGKHSLSSDMDYHVKAKVPRKYIENNPLGQAAGTGMDWLRNEASKVGVNINKSEFVNVAISIAGNMSKPKVKVKFLGTEGKTVQETAKDAVKDVVNSAAQKAKDEAQKRAEDAKKKLEAEARKKAAEARRKAQAELEKKVKDKVSEEVKDKVGDKVKEEADKVLGGKTEEVKDKVKDKLDKFNPFKKKKKDNGGGEE